MAAGRANEHEPCSNRQRAAPDHDTERRSMEGDGSSIEEIKDNPRRDRVPRPVLIASNLQRALKQYL